VPDRKFALERRGPRRNLGASGLQHSRNNDIVFLKEVAVKLRKK